MRGVPCPSSGGIGSQLYYLPSRHSYRHARFCLKNKYIQTGDDDDDDYNRVLVVFNLVFELHCKILTLFADSVKWTITKSQSRTFTVVSLILALWS